VEIGHPHNLRNVTRFSYFKWDKCTFLEVQQIDHALIM